MTTSPSWLLSLCVLLAFFMTIEAHMAMLYPRCRGGVGTKDFDWRIHQFVGYEGYKFPCGGYPKGPNTDLKAGQVINVRFWSSSMSDKEDNGKLPKMNIEQARHGGGMCEFSLSYDGGKSFHVIATYTKTCPDAAYEWPVKIPKNVPSCDDPGVEGGKLPEKTIQIYDFKGHKQGKSFAGDGKSHSHGAGPIESEINANLA
ncbi:hypothetical protein BGZ52_008594 [Haplosporangium bisporale]|nr:hypothetical protein BGZ52_008594 [Haplosporangium bisporale]